MNDESGRDSPWGSIRAVSFLNFTGQIVRVGSVLGTTLVAVRRLSPVEYAAFSWVGSMFIFIQTLLPLGFDQTFSYFFPRYQAVGESVKRSAVFRFGRATTAIAGALLFTTVGSLTLVIFPASGLGRLLPLVFATLLGWSLFALSTMYFSALRALEDYRSAIVAEQLLMPALPFALSVLVVTVRPTAIAVMLAHALGFALTIGYSHSRLRGFLREPTPVTERAERKSWLAYSAPVGLMLTAEILFYWIVLAIAGWSLSAVEVSFLAVALRSLQIFTFLNMAIAPLLMPSLARAHHARAGERLREMLHKLAYWMMGWSLTVGFALAVNRALLLSIFGPSFAGSSYLLLWLVPGALFEGSLGFIKYSSIAIGTNVSGLIFYAMGTGVAAATSLVLVPRLGLAGALIASSASLVFINTLRTGWLIRKNRIPGLASAEAFRLLIVAISLGIVFVALERHFGLRSSTRSLSETIVRLGSTVVCASLALGAVFNRDRGLLFRSLRG